MPDLWMPQASRLALPDTAPTDGGPAKAIAHITWDRNATATAPQNLVPYETLRSYFGGSGSSSAPHILWDPFTGRFTQYYPATSRSKSLADRAGGTRTNRAGSVVIQVEALFFPYCRVGGQVYARLVDTPCKGWAELNAWVKSWGVPDVWPMGRPTSFAPNRSETVWATKAGWYGHQHVPENDHQDPGSWPAFTTAQEDDMTPDESRMLKELYDGRRVAPWTYKGTDEPLDTYAYLRGTSADVKALASKVAELTAKVAQLEANGLTAAQISAIANAVADVQAQRLAE